MVRDREGAQADLAAHGIAYKCRRLAASMAGDGAGPAPLGALLFVCNARGSGLYQEASYDARQVAAYTGLQVAGFQCNGEIGSVGGGTKLHGFTAAVAILRAGVEPSGSSGSGQGSAPDGASG